MRRSQQSGKAGHEEDTNRQRRLSLLPQGSLFQFPVDNLLDTLLEHPLPAFVVLRNFITVWWSIQRYWLDENSSWGEKEQILL